MDFNQEYDRIMADHSEIALATCTDGKPNVRIVNFCCDPNRKGLIYFSTFRENRKGQEIAQNPLVAFTTIPHGGNSHVRVRNASAQISGKSVYDLKAAFSQKLPDYAQTIEQMGQHLVLYEVHFKEANVTIDMENSGDILL
jgi:pyridoxine/pyridoxamine 5'-phosphate oxidase